MSMAGKLLKARRELDFLGGLEAFRKTIEVEIVIFNEILGRAGSPFRATYQMLFSLLILAYTISMIPFGNRIRLSFKGSSV